MGWAINTMVLTGVLLGVGGCGDEPPPSESGTTVPDATSGKVTVGSSNDRSTEPPRAATGTTTGSSRSGIVELAIADLAQRTSFDASEIDVIAEEAVTWPDGSLGCPEPGRLYTQALVDGHLIVLGIGEERHEYHAGSNGQPFYCPSDRTTPPSVNPNL